MTSIEHRFSFFFFFTGKCVEYANNENYINILLLLFLFQRHEGYSIISVMSNGDPHARMNEQTWITHQTPHTRKHTRLCSHTHINTHPYTITHLPIQPHKHYTHEHTSIQLHTHLTHRDTRLYSPPRTHHTRKHTHMQPPPATDLCLERSDKRRSYSLNNLP